jgi:hypothetical protein
MTFGKFRGVEVADLPDDYLTWLHDQVELREPLLSAVHAEFAVRFTALDNQKELPAAVRTMVEELVSAGYRKLALQHHPDHPGGDTRTMQLVNAAAHFLRRAARKATS